eukprot:EC790707.1.p3 GENE.EC790707.1~~EC790707.1.p3  ORF type:complete len:84 (+),score=14.56 EC790707.1:207-458(+)
MYLADKLQQGPGRVCLFDNKHAPEWRRFREVFKLVKRNFFLRDDGPRLTELLVRRSTVVSDGVVVRGGEAVAMGNPPFFVIGL